MTLRLTLVNDWHKSWKWSSLRFLALSGTCDLILRYLKDIPQEVTQYINPHIISWIATISFILAIVGRVTQVEKRDDGKPNQ